MLRWPADRDHRRMKRCPFSRKRKYRSSVDAMVANADKPIPARAYRCPHCGFWHLTRREPDLSRQPPRAASGGERGTT